MDYSRPELVDRLAAEYVAGSLRGPARRRLEALLPAHPALRDAVFAWQERLAPLTASIEPQAPPAAVWQRIEARLDGGRAAVAAVGKPAAPRWWQRLAVWQGLSGLALAGVIGLGVLLASPGPVSAPVIVVLSPAAPPAGTAAEAVPASFVASISGDGRALVTRPLTRVAMQADRTLELWAVPAAGNPRSLGLIAADAPTVLRRGALTQGAAALAVSLEPPGGSPTGVPTGPVLYVGKLGT